MKKLVVWDFHGTLEEGNELAVLEISNIVLKNHGFLEQFNQDDCFKLYGKKWFEYFEYLIPSVGNKKHLELQEACFEFSINHPEIIAKYIKPAKNAHKVLDKLSKSHDQILISNTKPESLKMFLSSIKMYKYFTEKAYATDAHTQDNTKKDVLRKYLAQNKFDEVYTVGDSPSDAELGKEFGARTILYTHKSRMLKDCDADYKIRDLIEVVKIVNSLQ